MNASRLALALRNRAYQQAVFDDHKDTLRMMVASNEASAPHLEGHSHKIARLVVELAGALGLSADETEGLQLVAELHDVGMVGLNDTILFKPGRLTEQEYDTVKHHPIIGAAPTAPIRIPIAIASLILHHHERYDGFGYPDGLSGTGIPMGARILALREVLDAC